MRSIAFRPVWLVVFALSACAPTDSGPVINQQLVASFRADTAAISAFEAAHGKLGAFAMPMFAAMASRFTGKSFSETENLIVAPPTAHQSAGAASLNLAEGSHVITIADAGAQALRDFGPMAFRNRGTSQVALFLEANTENGQSLGFSYQQLEPGAQFRYFHNSPAVLVKVVIVGGVVFLIYEGGSRLFESGFRCHLVTKAFMPDYCTGSCGAGTSCGATATRPYGFLGSQASTCACI
ncbi:MAG TPA: hypothetical protein VJU18_01555 [Vicinamibacteria bacterium]|nr:hypothetical protein [Vicinamibacteria bacterium]